MSPHARTRLSTAIATLPLLALVAMTSLNNVSAQCLEPIQFDNQVKYFAGENPPFTATGDFNGDGIVDLAVANSDDLSGSIEANVTILLGKGAGGVGNGSFDVPNGYEAGHRPYGIAVGDYNEDDILDLAVTNFDRFTVAILLGQGAGGVGNGSFGPPSYFDAGDSPFHIVTADFNEDGILDLAVSNNADAAVSVLIGQGVGGVGDGTFAFRVQYPLNEFSTGIATADLNEDGILDLVATENFGGTVAVLLGQGVGGVGDGTFATLGHYPIGPEPVRIAIDDLDADGVLDVVATNTRDAGTIVLFGNGVGGVGNGSLGPRSTFLPSGNSGGVAVADFDVDGLLDIAVTYSLNNTETHMRLYLGNGTGGNNDGTFDVAGATDYPVGALPPWITVDDFNEDGKPDVVIPNYHSDFISLLLGDCLAEAPEEPAEPELVDVRDAPNDQGGKVFLEWLRSRDDMPGGPVNSYRVWRRVPPNMAAKLSASEVGAPGSRFCTTEMPGPDGQPSVVIFWEALADLPAQRLVGYGYTAATTQDSLPGSNPYTAFFVTALTSNIDVFYNSEIDSAYSVDNLAPFAPRDLAGVFDESIGVILEWDPNTEVDLSHYAIYRGTTEEFVPAPENLIGTSTEPTFVDGEGLFNYYKVSAIDIHTNESGFTGIASEDIPIPTLIKLFVAENADDGVHLTVELGSTGGNGTVTILRAVEPEVDLARLIAGPRSIGSGRFEVIDADVRPGTSYFYWLELRIDGRLAKRQGPLRVDSQNLATTTVISPAAPNPFAGRTTFAYVIGSDLAGGGDVPVSLKLYGPSGRLVRTLISGSQGAGEYKTIWDGSADSGARVGAGVYYYRFRIGDEAEQGRVVLIQ